VLPSGLRDTVGTLDSLFRSLIYFRDTQPAYAPVQRFQCSLATALAWLGVRAVRYSFLCMTLSFTTSRRFIPTLSTLKAYATLFRRLSVARDSALEPEVRTGSDSGRFSMAISALTCQK
jgi:hypothetical protein